MTYTIRELVELDIATEDEIFSVWERSIRATHDFFGDCGAEIRIKGPGMREALQRQVLVCLYVGSEIKGFAGICTEEIKMLYVHPDWRRKGIGRLLMEYSKRNHNVSLVDVYELNGEAVAFYRRMGFEVYGQSSKTDTSGKLLSVLHMKAAC